MDDLTKIQSELEKNAVNIKGVNLLFLDLSSSCTGYSLATVDFESKNAAFINSGVMWFSDDWSHQDKYHYVYNAIVNYFNVVGKVDYCIAEAYSINPNKVMGCLVGPEMHGAVQVALAEMGTKYSTIPPQTWRKQLGIKKDASGDFKKPTRDKIAQFVKLPDEIKSNITGNMRKTPNDLTDAIAVGLGALTKLGIRHFDFNSMQVQEPIELAN